MLDAIRRRLKGDKHKFHLAAALIYGWHPMTQLWNPSKSFYHFEQSIQGNHSHKSYFLYSYANALILMIKKYNIHQCDNANCTMIGNQTCGKCKKTYYCSRECQIRHWKRGHKLECQSKTRSKLQGIEKIRRLLQQAIEIEKVEGFTENLYYDVDLKMLDMLEMKY